MTIKQIYTHGREVFTIIITGKNVFWKDRKMPKPIQMIPMDEKIKKAILTSRNRIDKKLIEQFKLTKEEQKEYDEAISSGENIEERLAKITKKDALGQGGILQKEERL